MRQTTHNHRPMNDFYLTAGTLPDLIPLLQAELEADSPLKVSVGTPHIGKWGMARLWYSWMTTTAKFMAARKVTMPLMINANGEIYKTRAFNESDAHEMFTSMWLGVDNDGTRLSWSKKGREDMRAANQGERFHALRRHEIWAIDKGILLFKPREGEYYKLEQEENK